MEKLALERRGNVFATDAILAHLMACPRTIYPWDIVVQKASFFFPCVVLRSCVASTFVVFHDDVAWFLALVLCLFLLLKHAKSLCRLASRVGEECAGRCLRCYRELLYMKKQQKFAVFSSLMIFTLNLIMNFSSLLSTFKRGQYFHFVSLRTAESYRAALWPEFFGQKFQAVLQF